MVEELLGKQAAWTLWSRKTTRGKQLLFGDQILVLRSFSGDQFNPVKVVRHFSEATRLVKPHGHPSDSVFIGLPSFRDGRLVIEAARLRWPAGLDDE